MSLLEPDKSTTRPLRMASSDGPIRVGELAAKVLSGIVVVDRPVVSVEERQSQLEAQQQQRREGEKFRKWRVFIESRGLRYLECRLSNFECAMPKQTTAVNKLREYADDIRERVKAGENIVLYGPRGSGKDHLATAICREAVRNEISVAWVNGMDFFGDIRDAMDKRSHDSESSLIYELTRPELLYVSDPLPPSGNLTEFQQAIWFRVLDGRYSNLRPTIVTVNARDGKEIDERMGAQSSDRLRDNALSIACNWPSHRVAKQ